MINQEKHIILGLQNGDEETYIFLFREYYIALCSYSRRYVGRKDIAEEIVSETFFKVWQNRKKIQIATSIKAYLFQAVCNNSLNYLRKIKKEESLEDYFLDTSSENIGFDISPMEIQEQSLLMEDVFSQVENAINDLPPQQQKAFRLKRIEGKKNKEVAEIMDLSLKTVEMHLSKAILNLRNNLKDLLPAFLLFLLLK